MSKNLEELIKQTLNKSGKLDCGTAFKIANKLGIEVGEVSDEATRLGIKIDNCELGQFGGLDKDRGKFTLSLKLKEVSDEKGRVFCKDAREMAAANGGLKTMRSTLKFLSNSSIIQKISVTLSLVIIVQKFVIY